MCVRTDRQRERERDVSADETAHLAELHFGLFARSGWLSRKGTFTMWRALATRSAPLLSRCVQAMKLPPRHLSALYMLPIASSRSVASFSTNRHRWTPSWTMLTSASVAVCVLGASHLECDAPTSNEDPGMRNANRLDGMIEVMESPDGDSANTADKEPVPPEQIVSGGQWKKVIERCVPAVVAIMITSPRAFDTERPGVSQATGFIVVSVDVKIQSCTILKRSFTHIRRIRSAASFLQIGMLFMTDLLLRRLFLLIVKKSSFVQSIETLFMTLVSSNSIPST
jgi:hypothetical protein